LATQVEEKEMSTEQPIFVRMREVSAMIGLKSAAIDRAIRAGKFPRPFLIGVKAKAWDREEIMRWKDERDKERATYADPARPSPMTEAEKSARLEARWAKARAA
jgi:predicted DNA-binding transcriptional regulator AlpA